MEEKTLVSQNFNVLSPTLVLLDPDREEWCVFDSKDSDKYVRFSHCWTNLMVHTF